MEEYEESLKVYRDLKGVVDTSFEEGEKVGIEKGIEKGIDKGREKERMDIAKKLKTEGINIEIIVKSTGLSKEEIEKL